MRRGETSASDSASVEARFRSRATVETREGGRFVPAGETMTLRLEDEDTPRARLGRHRARVSTRDETRETPSHARAGPWDRGPGRADRGVPK